MGPGTGRRNRNGGTCSGRGMRIPVVDINRGPTDGQARHFHPDGCCEAYGVPALNPERNQSRAVTGRDPDIAAIALGVSEIECAVELDLHLKVGTVSRAWIVDDDRGSIRP